MAEQKDRRISKKRDRKNGTAIKEADENPPEVVKRLRRLKAAQSHSFYL